MYSKVARLANFKQIAGIAVAAIILTVIFVPFQTASAFTVNVPTLPNVTDLNAVPTSAVGSTFEVAIDVAPGELINIHQVELVLNNGQSSVKTALFNSDGQRDSGSPTLVRGNLEIIIPSPTTTGYGYGFGYVGNSVGFTSPYSYALVSPQYAFISGNTVGYSNAIGNAVTSFVGNGVDQIKIKGKLNTAVMTAGVPHTLDVFIHTGSGINPDTLQSPRLTFTPAGNSAVGFTNVTAGSNKTVEPNVSGVEPGKLKIKFANVGNGAVSVQKGKPVDIQTLLETTIFTSTSTNTATFSFSGSTVTTAGDVFEIDISGLDSVSGTIEITIPYDESLIPSGVAESSLRLYHWTGTVWEDVTTSVDTVNNTITGQVSSLSPVVTGYTSTTTAPTTGGGGGGGGGGGYAVIVNQTFPPDFFLINPLMKVQLQEAKFLNAQGQTAFGGKAGQQLSISADFRNYQQVAQPYAIIVQVIDKDGLTTEISWITGVADGGGSANTSRSLTLGQAGEYSVKIFVWDGVSMAPSALSEVTSRTFIVTN
jgi:hypothetical protein